jgi:hypothetical protein
VAKTERPLRRLTLYIKRRLRGDPTLVEGLPGDDAGMISEMAKGAGFTEGFLKAAEEKKDDPSMASSLARGGVGGAVGALAGGELGDLLKGLARNRRAQAVMSRYVPLMPFLGMELGFMGAGGMEAFKSKDKKDEATKEGFLKAAYEVERPAYDPKTKKHLWEYASNKKQPVWPMAGPDARYEKVVYPDGAVEWIARREATTRGEIRAIQKALRGSGQEAPGALKRLLDILRRVKRASLEKAAKEQG